LERDGTAEHLWQFINNLVESLRYSDNARKLQEESVKKVQEFNSKKEKLVEYLEEISKLSIRVQDELKSERAGSVLTKIQDFAETAVKEASKIIEEELQREASELNERINAERIKSERHIEKYLQSTPFSDAERSFKLSYSNGVYTCHATYTCASGIEYSFHILCHESKLFSEELKASTLSENELKIPIAVSSSWLRRKSSAKFEKISDYIVTEAEFSDKHSYIVLSDPDTNSRVVLSSPVPEEPDHIDVEYFERENKIDVTGTEELLPFIEREGIVLLISKLRQEIMSLENRKGELKEIKVDGDDILENLDVRKLVSKVLEKYGRDFRRLITESKGKDIITKSGKLSFDLIRGKLELIGANQRTLSSLLA
jgi:hypothetical protein